MTRISTEIKAEVKSQAQDLLNFIDASPSPWHAVDSVAKLLKENGFKPLIENQPWQFKKMVAIMWYVMALLLLHLSLATKR